MRKAVLRYRIEHPVVNDRYFEIWQLYGVDAWPTLIFIDPQGKVIGKHEGEFDFKAMDQVIGRMLDEFREKGLLDRTPLEFQPEQEVPSPLLFPGKVVADEVSGRLFIADTNHHRIIVSTLDGEVRQVVGSGEPGLADGTLASAQFQQPQGMAVDGDILYVADTENHVIRRVDLARGMVDTMAGTGSQGHSMAGGPARKIPLSSPWDTVLHNGVLYITMAGLHQLWALDLAKKQVYPYAGSGYEGLSDGPLAEAMLAQPSGIATSDRVLYFADSETSAIRTADLNSAGRVHTLVGLGLFVFGDVDGMGAQVRLQHPLGVCYYDSIVYVADSYNHKVKRLFPLMGVVKTFVGTGEAGYRDGPATQALLHEPGGVSIARGKLYIADTNNHLIRVMDLETGQVSTLSLRGI